MKKLLLFIIATSLNTGFASTGFRQGCRSNNQNSDSAEVSSLTMSTVSSSKLTSFTTQKIPGFINLTWTTAPERIIEKFDIERSADGKEWLTIGSVTGSSTGKSIHYGYTDGAPLTGKNYYRLVEYSADGATSTSHSMCEDYVLSGGIMVYSHPSNEKLAIQLPGYEDNTVAVKLTTIQGKFLEYKKCEMMGFVAQFIPSFKLRTGTYVISLSGTRLGYSQTVFIK